MPFLPLEKQEAYRRRYAGEHPGWQPASHVYRDRVAAHLGPSVRVLDLGCGRGGVVEELSERAGRFVGVDADWLSLAEHRLTALPRAVAQAEALPFPAGSFDLVCCSWVLEHLPDPGRALREVARVLAPGGRFVFLTPNVRHPLLALNRWLRWTRGRAVRWLYGRAEVDTFPALYRANTIPGLTALLRAAGLEPLAVIPISDPTYLAFNEVLYRLSVWAERWVPPSARVHLVGEALKT
ncbi:MAG: methyltransferase domain-containing protein [Anaerolineae bacterium]|nr:methyltransferase domain-containing protein [Anaerolineae bacterium]